MNSELRNFSNFELANKYMLKVKSRSTKKRCELCLKLAMNTPE